MVGSVPGCVDDGKDPISQVDAIAVLHGVDALGGHGLGHPKERLHPCTAIGSRRTGYQPRGINQMRNSAFVRPQGCAREVAEEGPCASCVVDMDVRNDEMCEVCGTHAQRLERLQHHGDIGSRARFY